MRTVVKIALIAALALVSARAKKRNRLQAIFRIKQQYGIWMMHLQFAKEGMDAALLTYFNDINLAALSVKGYEEQMLAYVSETIDIQANGMGIELDGADVHSAKNRIDIMWMLKGMPSEIVNMNFAIKTCSEQKKHSNILQFLHGNTKHNYVLSEDNDYSISFFV